MTKKKWIILIVSLLATIGILFLLQHTAWIHNYACSEEKHSGCCPHKDNPSLDVCDPCYYDECNFKILIKNLTN